MSYDVIVVGGGIMGVSTVYAWQQRCPHARIILFEGVHERTSSKGLRKIIREAYHDRDYAALAKVAKSKWETERPYCGFYARSGWVQEVESEYVKFHQDERAIQARDLSMKMETSEDLRFDSNKELWLDEDIGVVDASAALEALAREAAALGVECRRDDIAKLVVEDGVCKGVQDPSGSRLTASIVIVAAGAWTPGILESSKIAMPPDSAYVTATATATLRLSEDEFTRLKSMPILVANEGEVFPPNADRVMQITSTSTFPIRCPHDLKSMTCDGLKNRALLERILPEMKGRPLDISLYPELTTPYQHFIVDRAHGVDGLHIVAGGSYHGFKFMPVLGDLVFDCVQGVRRGICTRWTWDRSTDEQSIHGEIVPESMKSSV